jgi:hypothetical protein
MNLNSISAQIIQAAIAVHRELGPGLLESVYQGCMLIELQNMGVGVRGEVPLPAFYKGQKIRDEGYPDRPAHRRADCRGTEICGSGAAGSQKATSQLSSDG